MLRFRLEPGEELTIISHFGRPDDRMHELGEHEILVIIQGANDYISASWYEPGDLVSTWNHMTAHLYGVPEILSDEENYQMLSRLTDMSSSTTRTGAAFQKTRRAPVVKRRARSACACA